MNLRRPSINFHRDGDLINELSASQQWSTCTIGSPFSPRGSYIVSRVAPQITVLVDLWWWRWCWWFMRDAVDDIGWFMCCKWLRSRQDWRVWGHPHLTDAPASAQESCCLAGRGSWQWPLGWWNVGFFGTATAYWRWWIWWWLRRRIDRSIC